MTAIGAIEKAERGNRIQPSVASADELGSLDVAKFVLSIVIVAIHASIGGSWKTSFIYPWARLAVPLFFIISAYLFFKKYNAADEAGKSARLRKFVKRNAQLYLFWLIVLLVPTLFLRDYFDQGVLLGLVEIVDGFFFGSTFVASWYITASVIAVLLVVLLGRILPNLALLALAVLCYIFACFASNYGNAALWNGATTAELLGGLSALDFPSLACPYNNFIVALLWVMVGKLIAEHEAGLKRFYRFHTVGTFLLLAASLVVLFVEQYAIRLFGTAYANDCYLTLPFSAALIMIVLLNVPLSIKHGKELRAASIITYCIHATFIRMTVDVLRLQGIQPGNLAMFLAALAVCWLVTFVILKLENKSHLGFLRYAH